MSLNYANFSESQHLHKTSYNASVADLSSDKFS